MNTLRPWLAFGLGGFVVGICLSLGVASAFLAHRIINRPVALAATQPATVELEGMVLATRTPMPAQDANPQAVPPSVADAWFAQADQMLAAGEPQQVLDLLRPKLDFMKDKQDRADAYYYMGQAEFQLGHYQLAAAQFAKLQEIEPSAEHLLMVATAYDTGGDLDHALASYEALLRWQGYVSPDHYNAASTRAQELRRIIGTPTPRPS
jgi:tetratricopeptide (TPR) repeat protein